MQRDLQFLLDILQSAELIMTYTAQCSKDEFVGNVQLQDSVIWRLLVIAEAVRRVSDDIAIKIPDERFDELRNLFKLFYTRKIL
jgi:uncharacterized protein with HEPN domain